MNLLNFFMTKHAIILQLSMAKIYTNMLHDHSTTIRSNARPISCNILLRS